MKIKGIGEDPRIILKKALEEDAVSIILCHNHPSGSLKPNRARSIPGQYKAKTTDIAPIGFK